MHIAVLVVHPEDMHDSTLAKELARGDACVVAAVGSGDAVGENVETYLGTECPCLRVEPLTSLNSVLERMVPDIALLNKATLQTQFDVVSAIARSGCSIAVVVDEEFPSSHETERLLELDELALRSGVSACCYGSVSEFVSGLNTLIASEPGMVPQRLY